jgi:signal transduction histidine kinase
MPGAASLRVAGKHREIALAVACFLVFDLAVLVLNFVISYQIAADAQAINLAGRQRMLSQRIAKSLFILEAAQPNGAEEARAELLQSTMLFGATLETFTHGGTVGGGDGAPVRLEPVQSANGQAILARAAAAWQPLAAALGPVNQGSANPPALRAAVTAARAANLPLLDLMNQLTNELETLARGRTDRLRTVQTAGIVLALLNFCFILFKFLARLSSSDAAAETARRETVQILGSVREGLFLIDRERRIGTQASACLPAILGRPAHAGAPFAELLASLAEPAVCAAAADFIDLLFDGRIKPALMAELNPLAQMRIPGSPERYLNFRFNVAGGAPDGMVPGKPAAGAPVSHLLVTVADITGEVLMQRDLVSARHKAKGEIEMLLGVLGSSPGALVVFAADAEAALRRANRLLRHPGEEAAELRQTVDTVFRLMHAIKGDAAAMGLALFETQAHEVEAQLAVLRGHPALRAEDLLGLPLKLEEFYERLSLVRAFADQIARAAARVGDLDSGNLDSGSADGSSAHQAGKAQATDTRATDTSISLQMSEQLDVSLTQLAQRIAEDQHKEVHVETSLEAMAGLTPATAKHVKDIALQLARNAVAHGIEEPAERLRAAKPEAGRLQVRLARVQDGDEEGDEYELVLRDDGRGLNPEAIRAELSASGRYSPAQLEDLDDRQILMKIFEPGFSTARPDGRDAGRGVGLDLVQDKIRRLGGRLRLASQPGSYTEFAVRFAA